LEKIAKEGHTFTWEAQIQAILFIGISAASTDRREQNEMLIIQKSGNPSFTPRLRPTLQEALGGRDSSKDG